MNELSNIEYEIYELDGELTSLIPWLKRRECTPRVMEEADQLLDQRNELKSILGEIVLDEMEELMQN